jgi:hypothetical protein
VLAVLLAATAEPVSWSVVYLSLDDARIVLEYFRDQLPAELQTLKPDATGQWEAWLRTRDSEIRARVTAGEEESLVNLMLFGTSFTSQRRITPADLLAGNPAGATDEAAREAGRQFGLLLRARMDDFLRALTAPHGNERLVIARRLLETKGLDPAVPENQDAIRRYLLGIFVRMSQQQAHYAELLATARSLEEPAQQFIERSQLFRDRGLSVDTSLTPNFAVQESLAELRDRGWLTPHSIRRAAVLGPGLDFADKQTGYDFYPLQSLQPVAIVDSLLRLGLAAPGGVQVVALDLNPQVITHLARAQQAALRGQPYTIQLPRDPQIPWNPAFTAYWRSFGDQVGTPAPPVPLPRALASLQIRAVRVRPEIVARVEPVELNIVVQRLRLDAAREGFELIVATNILVYYDSFEQSLALANLASMLRPGGLLLSNNAVPEVPGLGIRSVGYRTTVYSSRTDDGDHIVWYQKSATAEEH